MTRIAGPVALALAICMAPPLAAAQDPAALTAEQAAEDLRAAIAALDQAQGAQDRIQALTRTIRAYEAGLSGLRDALRRTHAREGQILAEFDASRGRLGRVIAAMAVMERDDEPLMLLHPDGALATVRAGLMMESVAPVLSDQARTIADRLRELRRLRMLQQDTAEVLQRGLAAVQAARASLSQAVQDRTDLPDRFLEDPEELTALVNSADSLDMLADGIAELETDIGAPMGDFEGAKGSLPMPVRGRILRHAGEADAAGVVRPGIVVETDPGALVTLPWDAVVRYAGPLLDYENVMIVEPAPDYLLILAGLGQVFGRVGDVLEAGMPVGFMPERRAASSQAAGIWTTETLYIELRQGDTPIDPAAWFAETREE